MTRKKKIVGVTEYIGSVILIRTVKVMTSITAKNALTAAPLNSAVLRRQQHSGYQVRMGQ